MSFLANREQIALLLATVLGRVPIWVLLFALLSARLDARAFACLYTVLLICRAYIAWYKRRSSSLPQLITDTLWKHYFRWILRWLLFAVASFGIVYAFLSPNIFDFTLLLIAFGLSIPIYALSILTPKQKKSDDSYLTHTRLLKLAIILLWGYVAFTNEPTLLKAMALALIYTLEFLSVCKREVELNAAHS